MPALAANLPLRRTTLESADVAHVQLPRDLLRTPPRPSTRAYAAGRDLELEPNLDSSACARLLACTFALLARYAQQQELAFDVALHLGELRDARGGRVQWALDEGSFADLSAALVDQLAGLPALRVRDASRRSNVAVTLLGARAKLTLDELPSAHDLHFIFHEQPSGVALLVAYDYGAFKASSIERMIDAFALSLQVAKQDLTLAVRALPAVSHDEARAVAERGRGPAAREVEEPVAVRFQRVARAFAHATALRFRGQHMSYAELDQRSDQLARYLIEAGASTVAVCLSPSLDVLVALLACLKAGAVYVPLDPSYPSTLLELIVDEVGAQLALTDQTVDKLPAALPRLVMDRDFQACVIDADRPLPLPQVALDQDAYVLYTSGTTGRPKGVLATQRN
ncbi:MAG TPA: AMP-binding protein, partial [Polyangiales bacterium]